MLIMMILLWIYHRWKKSYYILDNLHAIGTGIAIQLPSLTEAQIRPRSGLAYKHGITVLNTPGTIDEGYTGELKVILINHGQKALNGP